MRDRLQPTPRARKKDAKDVLRQMGSTEETETIKALVGANERRFRHGESTGRPRSMVC
jgi:hypothetical protein